MRGSPGSREGSAEAHGAIWDGKGTNFALFSANATKVEVCLFDAGGETELERIELPEYTDQIWHGYMPDVGPAPSTATGARPLRPEGRAPFQSEQAAARSLCPRAHRRAEVGPGVFGYTLGAPDDDLTFDERDSAPFMPKCVVVDPDFDWTAKPRKQGVPWDRTIMYEAHVKGFTKRHPGVPEHLRGTYAGLGTKQVIDYIEVAGRDLHRAAADPYLHQRQHLLEKGLTNYWGYNSIGFFAPDPRYAADAPATACASSRRWSRASTMPASR